MRQFWTVLAYSYKERFWTKGFLLTTLITVLLIGLTVNFPTIYNKTISENIEKIAVIDETGALIKETDSLKKYVSNKYDWILEKPARESKLREQVREDDLAGLVVIRQASGTSPKVDYIVKREDDAAISAPLQNYIQGLYTYNVLSALPLTKEDYTRITAKLPFEVVPLIKTTANNFWFAYLMIMLLYISILMYGTLVSTAVAAEKSSRIMELLITTVRPIWLLLGKIIGVGLLGLTQFAIFLSSAYLFYRLGGKQSIMIGGFPLDFSTIPPAILFYLMLFFLLGYFLYAALYAAMGSLVSRTEDLTSVMLPLTLVIFVAFFGTIYAMKDPDSTLSVVGSLVPFSSPMMMFIRIAMTQVPLIQIIASIIILLISILIAGWVSAKIYRVGVLLYGKTPNLKEIYSTIKDYKV